MSKQTRLAETIDHDRTPVSQKVRIIQRSALTAREKQMRRRTLNKALFWTIIGCAALYKLVIMLLG